MAKFSVGIPRNPHNHSVDYNLDPSTEFGTLTIQTPTDRVEIHGHSSVLDVLFGRTLDAVEREHKYVAEAEQMEEAA